MSINFNSSIIVFKKKAELVVIITIAYCFRFITLYANNKLFLNCLYMTHYLCFLNK